MSKQGNVTGVVFTFLKFFRVFKEGRLFRYWRQWKIRSLSDKTSLHMQCRVNGIVMTWVVCHVSVISCILTRSTKAQSTGSHPAGWSWWSSCQSFGVEAHETSSVPSIRTKRSLASRRIPQVDIVSTATNTYTGHKKILFKNLVNVECVRWWGGCWGLCQFEHGIWVDWYRWHKEFS